MKKKFLSAVCMLAFCLSLAVQGNVSAAEEEIIDGSKLTHQNESIGYAEKSTKGKYLLAGYSKCVKGGDGKIFAGGTTIAVESVEKIHVTVMVERVKKGEEAWECCDSWEKTNHNMDRVGSNRALAVEGGYYYRVRSLHSANDDVSSSFTDGIYIE